MKWYRRHTCIMYLKTNSLSYRAFNTLTSVMPKSLKAETISSLLSTEVVPINIGRPFSWVVRTFFRSAYIHAKSSKHQCGMSLKRPRQLTFIFPSFVLNTASSLSLRASGRAVGIGKTFKLYTSKNSSASVNAVPVIPLSFGNNLNKF